MQAFVLFVQQESEFSCRVASNESMSKHVDWPWHVFPLFFRVLPASFDCPDSASWLMRVMLYAFIYVLPFSSHFNGFTVNSTVNCGRHARGFHVLSEMVHGIKSFKVFHPDDRF